jgi:2-C-methyl-D-erythritol 2,4-cyclodiphosphate synthase
VGTLALALMGLLAFPEATSRALDDRFGDWVWNQRGNFEARGLPLHLLQEGVRSRARREPAPRREDVAMALLSLGGDPRPGLMDVEGTLLRPPRNLHVIVLESFWDPLLLGAAGLGDIGRHFPDTDPEFLGADSRVLLRKAYERVLAAGWQLVNLDATIHAQAPKIGPHAAAMVANIASDLGVSAADINIKAKTNEGLGHLGRKEGIAANVVALVRRR